MKQITIINKPNTEICLNIYNKPSCLCLYNVEVAEDANLTFRCVHCRRFYHTTCMKKVSSDQHCGYCQLQRMIPTRRVSQTVYLGYLKKSALLHQAKFYMPQIAANQYYQFRCLRLKEGAQSSCLFPDIAEFQLNNHIFKVFNPINKQSNLKYRKDEPFRLLKADYLPEKQNSLMISELIGNRPKEIRYEAQNHLIGLYIVQNIQLQALIDQIKTFNVTDYLHSKRLLDNCFQFIKFEQDLTCELIKIPLVCPLSTQKISIPARGIFCSHFQCFDMKTYIIMISESTNPRWKCPICNKLAYQLQIDCILQAILAENNQKSNSTEIIFYKNGDYSSIVDDSPSSSRKNIQNLKLCSKKRQGLSLQNQKEGLPRKKPIFIMPLDAKIIQLDD